MTDEFTVIEPDNSPEAREANEALDRLRELGRQVAAQADRERERIERRREATEARRERSND